MNPILLQSPFNKGDLVESKLNELYPEDEGRYYMVTGFELRDIDADGFVS